MPSFRSSLAVSLAIGSSLVSLLQQSPCGVGVPRFEQAFREGASAHVPACRLSRWRQVDGKLEQLGSGDRRAPRPRPPGRLLEGLRDWCRRRIRGQGEMSRSLLVVRNARLLSRIGRASRSQKHATIVTGRGPRLSDASRPATTRRMARGPNGL